MLNRVWICRVWWVGAERWGSCEEEESVRLVLRGIRVCWSWLLLAPKSWWLASFPSSHVQWHHAGSAKSNMWEYLLHSSGPFHPSNSWLLNIYNLTLDQISLHESSEESCFGTGISKGLFPPQTFLFILHLTSLVKSLLITIVFNSSEFWKEVGTRINCYLLTNGNSNCLYYYS